MPNRDSVSTEIAAGADISPSYFRILVAAINRAGELIYADQLSENGPMPQEFTRLGTQSYTSANLQASTTMDGYVSILAARSENHHLMYFAESRSDTGGGRFSDPEDLGLPKSTSGFDGTNLINGLNGLANIFGVTPGHEPETWWKFENPYTVETVTEFVTPPGMKQPIEVTVQEVVPPSQRWSDWAQIPGKMVSVSAANNADGRIFLAGLDDQGCPSLNVQTDKDPDSPEFWSGWTPLDPGVGTVSQIEMMLDANSLLHIFASCGQNIYMKVQTEVGKTSFTDWVMFAMYSAPVNGFAVGAGVDGLLCLTAQIGTKGPTAIFGSYQLPDAPNSWSQPAKFATNPALSELVLQPNADARISLFARSAETGLLRSLDQVIGNFWSVEWKTLHAEICNFATTQDVSRSGTASQGAE